MTTQRTLPWSQHDRAHDLVPIASPTYETESIADRFEAFHRANPHVFDAIVRVSRNLRDAGARRGGMKMVFERLRWLYALKTGGDAYKLNNDFTALYARKVMDERNDLEGFFRLRVRKAVAV